MANTYLTRNEVDPQGNRKTFTLSQWIKKTDLGVEGAIFCHRLNNNYYFHIRFNTDDTLKIQEYANSSQTLNWQSNRKFRDINAWYHIVCAFDTTQATDSNRIKVYVNGIQETSLAAVSYPSQNLDLGIDGGAGYASHYGQRGDGAMYLGCVMSHAHYTQGTAYDASAFGSTDATTGEWKINTAPNVTYGTKGYFILKDGNSVTDSSSNSNNFSVGGGTLTKTEDCPSNVFCTLNPNHLLGIAPRSGTFSNGNTKVADANSNWQGCVGTIGAYSGKWYWEYQLVGGTYHMPGIVPDNGNFSQSGIYTIDYGGMGYSAYVDNGTIRARFNNADISGWNASGMGNTSFSANDYINFAVDMDNKFMYIGKNGTWFKSGDPTSGATGTGGINISATFTSGIAMLPAYSNYNGTTGQFNFGNGYIGTTAVSSAGTNASNNGIFEYDVPSGYTAISTKGLNL